MSGLGPTQNTLKINFVIHTFVAEITQEERIVSGRKVGDETVLEKETLGWFVRFDGSHEKMFFGVEHPPYTVGDKVKITIEKINV